MSDIILLGTDEHVRLAAHAAQELVAGRPVHTGALVASLRDFIRSALALAPIPNGVTIPAQGPTRPAGTGGRGKGETGRDDTRTGGKTGGGVGGAGMGGGMGGVGMGLGTSGADPDDPSHPQR
ncbi:hypothetical protein M9980_03145 [Sphingomonas donggukensis]|uniref:Uncharacterized protein n=1 Tax=Sphingomonas donggukensis TaxID=2949093 RepID=A0ABY4U0E0_9SPHN|nr:hypothetical protein [Sphingomonas donggukensis]URW76236.1 hypothetical protein M9980_03145 [Sphingomonas donggukensis]